jgi:molybdenum cofactor cytidylyltransferase
MIGAIMLAAGSSRRFGDDKRRSLLPSGQQILEESIHKAASVIDEVLVVLRFGDREFAQELDEKVANSAVKYFCAPDSAKGMGSSLANAVREISDWQAALVFLGDMPFVQAETVESLLAEYEFRKKQHAPIVLPTQQGVRGHPVLFHKQYFPEMMSLSGDQGAKSVIQAHPSEVFEVEVLDPGAIRDIDTPDDLAS